LAKFAALIAEQFYNQNCILLPMIQNHLLQACDAILHPIT